MFFADLVRPLLARNMPRLRYAAGRLGSGSDVLGLDDVASRDHDWGCRLTLLVDEADHDAVSLVDELLARELPAEYRGLPVRFAMTWDSTVRTQGPGRYRRRLRRESPRARPLREDQQLDHAAMMSVQPAC